MSATPKLGVTLVATNAVQKEVIINEALIVFDAMVSKVALDIVNAPPGAPVDGDVHIVGTAPTGAFAGMQNQVAFYYSGWRFIAAPDHLQFYVTGAASWYQFSGGVWNAIPASTVAVLNDLTDVATVDPTDGQVLTYHAATSKWISTTLALVNTLSALTDVDITGGLATGQALAWLATDDGGKWVPHTFATGTIVTTLAALTDVDETTAPTNGQVLTWQASDDGGKAKFMAVGSPSVEVENLSDVTIVAGLAAGQVLTYNGSGEWYNATPTEGSITVDDGTTTVDGVSSILVVGGTVTMPAAGHATITFTGGGVTVGGTAVTSLAAGANVTFTEAEGVLTIAAAGGGGGGGATTLAALTDVDETTAPTNGQALVYDTATGKWKPGTVASGGGSGGGGSAAGFAGLGDELVPPDTGPVPDAYAVQACHVHMTADATISGIKVVFQGISGSNYQAYLYQLDSSGNVTATLGHSLVYSPDVSSSKIQRIFAFVTPVDLVSGGYYALAFQIVGQGGTAECATWYKSGVNTFASFPADVVGAISFAVDGAVPDATAPAHNSSDNQCYWVAPVWPDPAFQIAGSGGSGGGFGLPTVVQQVFAHIQGSGQPVTLPAAPTAGNTLVAIIAGAGDGGTGDSSIAMPGADWNVIAWSNNSSGTGIPGEGPSFQQMWVAAKAVATGDSATIDYNSTNGANVYLIEFEGLVAVDCSGIAALSNTTGSLVLSGAGSVLSSGLRFAVIECDGGDDFTFADGTITRLYEAPEGSGHYGVVGELPAGYNKPIVVNYTSAPNYPLGAVISVATSSSGSGGSSTLAGLTDVEATGGHAPTDGEALIWSVADSKWKPGPATSAASYRGPWTVDSNTQTDQFTVAAGVPSQYAVSAGSQRGIGIVAHADAALGTTACLAFLGTDGVAGDNVSDNSHQQFQFNCVATATDNTLALHYLVNSENNFDGMNVYVDGVLVLHDFTDRTGTTAFIVWTYTLPVGPHTVEIAYTADSRNQNGYENVHFSQISYPVLAEATPFVFGDVVSWEGKLWSCITPGTLDTPQEDEGASGWAEYWVGAQTNGTSTLVKLAEVILTADAPSIDFSSIVQGYRNLIVRGSVRTTSATLRDDCCMTFNGDTGANYTRNLNAVDNAGASYTWDATRPNIPNVWAAAANATAGFFSTFETTVYDYDQTDRTKNVSGIAASTAAVGDDYNATVQGMWFNEAAITELTFTPGSGAGNYFVPGSRIAIYGEFGPASNSDTGSRVLLQDVSVTAATSGVALTQFDPNTYLHYEIEFSGLGADGSFALQASTDGGATFDASGTYDWAFTIWGSGGYDAAQHGGGSTSITLGNGAAAPNSSSGKVSIYDPANATAYMQVLCDASFSSGDGNSYRSVSGGAYKQLASVNAVKVVSTTGNITAGRIRLYGIPIIGKAPASRSLVSYTVTAAEPAFTLTIPPGARNIKIVSSMRGDDAAVRQDASFYFNGDNGSDYYWNLMQLPNGVVNATTVYPRAGGISACYMPCGGANAGYFGTSEILIPAYDKADRIKAFQCTATSPASPTDNLVNVANATWSNMSAISTITFSADHGNFAVGTQVDVYAL